MEIVAVDIGGTHARFALAEVGDGRVQQLGAAVTLRAAEHASLQTAWEAFAATLGRKAPEAAGIAIAGPVGGAVLTMANNPWVIRPALIEAKLGVATYTIVNDFAAVGHAVVQLPPASLSHLCGPDEPLPAHGVTTILGPGTGLGVAAVLRQQASYTIIATEGGHTDFAPVDALEDAILAQLRRRYRRVSTERIVSGPGLANLHEALAHIEGRAVLTGDDKALWTAALDGSDSLAAAALDRFCLSLGSVAGDLALAQGASAVVIAGGLGLKLAKHLPRSGFGTRFVAKGRFEGLMASLPVKLITFPEPGLYGAAAAFAQEHT
jgi:glucokinase